MERQLSTECVLSDDGDTIESDRTSEICEKHPVLRDLLSPEKLVSCTLEVRSQVELIRLVTGRGWCSG